MARTHPAHVQLCGIVRAISERPWLIGTGPPSLPDAFWLLVGCSGKRISAPKGNWRRRGKPPCSIPDFTNLGQFLFIFLHFLLTSVNIFCQTYFIGNGYVSNSTKKK